MVTDELSTDPVLVILSVFFCAVSPGAQPAKGQYTKNQVDVSK
jgi:hypothetical protein